MSVPQSKRLTRRVGDSHLHLRAVQVSLRSAWHILISLSTCIILVMIFLSRKIVAGKVGNSSQEKTRPERNRRAMFHKNTRFHVMGTSTAPPTPSSSFHSAQDGGSALGGEVKKIEYLCYTPHYANHPLF